MPSAIFGTDEWRTLSEFAHSHQTLTQGRNPGLGFANAFGILLIECLTAHRPLPNRPLLTGLPTTHRPLTLRLMTQINSFNRTRSASLFIHVHHHAADPHFAF